MKKFSILFIVVLFPVLINAQNTVDVLIEMGIECHDNQEYKNAIEMYKKALEIEPESSLINYEIAMSYMYMGEFEESIKHCFKVTESEDVTDDIMRKTYTVLASNYSYLNKTDKAIEIYKKTLNEYGEHYLIYFNMGVVYYKTNDFENAKDAFIRGIENYPYHASSHLLLGYLMKDMGQRIPAILSLHYFLLLEQDSDRAVTAYNTLQTLLTSNISRDEDDNNNINIILSSNQMESDFGAAELMLAMLEVSNSLEENKELTEEELFIENTTSFFKILGELNTEENEGIWWEFYIPFYDELAGTEHLETYCYYICLVSNEKAINWLENNINRFEEFIRWLEEKDVILKFHH